MMGIVRRHVVRHRLLLFALLCLLIPGLALIAAIFWSDRTVGQADLRLSLPFTPELIAKGAYVARVADCSGCHSVAGRPPFSGGLPMQIPIGTLVSSNITPDPEHGIGRWSLSDFDRALRFGVADNHSLYPAMPFTSYARFRRDEVEALYAYFRYGIPSAALGPPANRIPFPLSLRMPLTIWRWAFAPAPIPFASTSNVDPTLQRGAYLVEVGGHCGECHTARGLGLQMKASQASDGPLFLAGGVADGWFAPSLRNGGQGGLGNWSEDDITAFLLTGRNRSGIAFGGMSDAVVHGTSHLTSDDAHAMAHFLKSLSGEAGGVWAGNAATATALHRGDVSARGSLAYLNNCAACHRPDGAGYEAVFPALAGNPVVESADPTSLVRIILQGARTPRTKGTPAQFDMPALGPRMTNQEVADVATFIRQGWGNHGSSVLPNFVRKIRRDSHATAPPRR